MTELIIPRKTIYFEPHEGSLVELSTDIPEPLRRPLVRAPHGDIEGLESGYRSGILPDIEGKMYKLKGCRPSEKVIYREPKGSQFLWMAQHEAENVLQIRSLFLREGYPYPIEPIGFWIYDNILVKNELTAATLYRISGDTRLDELLGWLEKDVPVLCGIPDKYKEAIVPIFEKLGVMTGRLFRTLHNNHYSWDWISPRSNSHPGNVIVFPDYSEKINLGLVDFDNVLKFNPKTERRSMKDTQEHDLECFTKQINSFRIVSGSRRKRARTMLDQLATNINRRVSRESEKQGLAKNLEGLVGNGNALQKEFGNSFETMSVRTYFLDGLQKGYKNPDTYISEISLRDIRDFKQNIRDLGNDFRRFFKKEYQPGLYKRS